MKSRELKKELNTDYIVSDHDDYIAIGNRLYHTLFKLYKKTMHVECTLDYSNLGRLYFERKGDEDLLFIWDRLHELIKTREIYKFMNGQDIIKNPLPVYSVLNGDVILSYTDEYDWPNTTIDGKLMYENTHFENRKNAIKNTIKNKRVNIELYNREIKEVESRKKELIKNCNSELKDVEKLIKLLRNSE